MRCQPVQCRRASDAALIALDLNKVKESNAMPLYVVDLWMW